MSVNNYILDDDGNPKVEPDLLKWAQWYETHDRHVAHDTIGDAEVSTVFLGIDHNFIESDPPVLWETMIFGGGEEFDLYQHRYCTREAALAGHAEAVALVTKRWKEIQQLEKMP